MLLDRRRVLASLGALPLCTAPSFGFSQTRITMAQTEVFSVSDGNLVLPGEMAFGGLPQAELQEILAEMGVSASEQRPPCNLTLLRQENRTILFDAGSGSGFMPSAGTLLDSLDTIGVSPDDVTHVVFTHAHPDHLWGVLDDFNDQVFPGAELIIGQQEWDYWTDPNTINTIGEARASFAVGAARRLVAISDNIRFVQDGEEILPGIMAHATFGHTPGHLSFEIRSGSNALMVGGDAIGNHHVAFVRPDWPSGSDQDTETGIKSRMRLLDQLATDQMLLLGFHLPKGGLGRVERRGNAYHFVTEDI